jgi:hypothetical protein
MPRRLPIPTSRLQATHSTNGEQDAAACTAYAMLDALCMYCSCCFFANQRESLSWGDPSWRNCFNSAAAHSCQSCGQEDSACGRSMWLSEDALAAAAAELVAAYVDATADLMELPMRGRWQRARVVMRCEELIQCSAASS